MLETYFQIGPVGFFFPDPVRLKKQRSGLILIRTPADKGGGGQKFADVLYCPRPLINQIMCQKLRGLLLILISSKLIA